MRLIFSFGLLLLMLLISACQPVQTAEGITPVPDGDRERGRQALADYGCGACHAIPGVPGAEGLVGPPLKHWANRGYIAGLLPNTPENLIPWLMNPQSFEPGTAMPNMEVTLEDATDMAAFLFSLRDSSR